MARQLFAGIDALLAPEVLSRLAGRAVHEVRCTPYASDDGFSGNRFLLVETNGGHAPRHILKRIRWEWDWLMRASEDRRGREVLAWQTGLLDRLPRELAHAVVACAVDGAGWALLLRDMREALIPPGDGLIRAQDNVHLLDAMAALHAAFWQRPKVADPALGFCSLRQHYATLSLATGRREIEGPSPVPRMIVEGCELLAELVEPTVADLVRGLMHDSRPLCDALARCPQTVIHGDMKLGNLGLLRGSEDQVLFLDWSRVGPAPPAVDLAWYLAVNAARLPVPKEAAIGCYRNRLAQRLGSRFDASWWEPQLALSLLGAFVELGWAKAHGAVHSTAETVRARERAELAWWSVQALAGARWL